MMRRPSGLQTGSMSNPESKVNRVSASRAKSHTQIPLPGSGMLNANREPSGDRRGCQYERAPCRAGVNQNPRLLSGSVINSITSDDAAPPGPSSISSPSLPLPAFSDGEEGRRRMPRAGSGQFFN